MNIDTSHKKYAFAHGILLQMALARLAIQTTNTTVVLLTMCSLWPVNGRLHRVMLGFALWFECLMLVVGPRSGICHFRD